MRITRKLELTSIYLLLVLAAVFAIGPLLWAVSTSFKQPDAVITLVPHLLPQHFTWKNYHDVLFGSHMPHYFLNSTIVTLGTLIVTLTAGSLGGYAAARYRFRGKSTLLFLILASIMIPGVVVLVPLYLISSALGLHNTYTALILVYSAWQTPFVLWLMQGFFSTIPRELEESAMMDGLSWGRTFWNIILPLARPGLAAAAIVVFVWVWNEFILAFTLISSDSMRVINNGLYFYISVYGIEWGKLMAASLIATIPEVLFFVLLQKSFVKGLTMGAVKG